MHATIHQSYFIPWLGYFSKLSFSDTFVVLDNVHFRKRHFFDRTRIVNMHSEIHWLSLPVGQNYQINCNEVVVSTDDIHYVEKIIKTIEQSYAKARYFDEEWVSVYQAIFDPLSKFNNLVDINLGIIINLIKLLEIDLPIIHLASKVVEDYDDPTDRIINICQYLKINSVIIGGGMSLSTHNWERVKELGIDIYIQDYLRIHPKYEQSRRKWAGFEKGLSIIDALLNVGRDETRNFLTDPIYYPVLAKEFE